jgi:hypothetical protein
MIVAVLSAATACQGGDSSPGATVTAGTVAAADYAVVTGVVQVGAIPDAQRLPESSVLGGPHFALWASEVATMARLDAEWLRGVRIGHDGDGPLLAGDGRELLLVRLSDIPALKGWQPAGTWHEVDAKVIVDGRARHLGNLTAGDAVLITAVPIHAPVTLMVTDEGKTQSIDLRTGRPGSGAVSAYTRPPSRGSIKYDVPVVPRPEYVGGFNVKVDVSATLRPFDGRRNGVWARSGRMWMDVSLKVTFWGNGTLGGELDVARSLLLHSGATALKVPPGTAPLTLEPASVTDFTVEHRFDVDVPDDLRVITISFKPTGKFTYDGKPLSYRVTGSSSATLKLSR